MRALYGKWREWWGPVAAGVIVILLGLNLWVTLHAATGISNEIYASHVTEPDGDAIVPVQMPTAAEMSTAASLSSMDSKLDTLQNTVCATAPDRLATEYFQYCSSLSPIRHP